VQITTESAFLQTFWFKFGLVNGSIIAAFSVSTVLACTDISLFLRKILIYVQKRLLSARSSDVRPRQKCIFAFKISFVVPTGLILYSFWKRHHFCVDCTLFGENWLTINKYLGGKIRPGGSCVGEPFYLYIFIVYMDEFLKNNFHLLFYWN
jgi:hypothetical protein